MAENLIRRKQLNAQELTDFITGSVVDTLYVQQRSSGEFISGQIDNYNSKSGFSNYAIANTFGSQTIGGQKTFTSQVFSIPGSGASGLVTYNQLKTGVDGSGFITTSDTGQFISQSELDSSGFSLSSSINSSGFLTGMAVTGASVINPVSMTGLGLIQVIKNANEIRIQSNIDSSGFLSSYSMQAVTGVKVTGSNTITGQITFTGLGGTQFVVNGNEIQISGGAGGTTSVGAVTGISVTGSASISGAITFTGNRGVETSLNGNEVQFRGPLTQYVSIAANTGTYTFSNLNSNVDGNYTVLTSIKCPGNVDQEYYIYVNGNEANEAYNSQKQIYSGASLTASQQNKPLFAVNTLLPSAEIERTDINSRIRVSANKSNTGFYYFSEVGLAEGGTYVTALSGIYRETFFGTFMRTITGAITSLTVASQSISGIGANSHISLYKIPVSF